MAAIRIIPRLDIKGPNLVKGIHLEGLRVLGKPEEFAKFYYEQGADELFFQDVVASLYERNSLREIITKTTKEIFIPITVGGGIRTVEDINNVLRAGADKVCINTAAVNNPDFIRKASRAFGSSTIVVAIEAIKKGDGNYYAYTDNGREQTGLEVIQWAKRVEELGAGEILITAVDKEGTGEGFDCALIKSIAKLVSIPVIAHGGASGEIDILNVINECQVNAIALASVLHYQTILQFEQEKFTKSEGNKSFLKSGRTFSKITPTTIANIKQTLKDNGIQVRSNEREK